MAADCTRPSTTALDQGTREDAGHGGGLGPRNGKAVANPHRPAVTSHTAFDPAEASMASKVTGPAWSEGTLGDMSDSVSDAVVRASRAETLQPRGRPK